MISFHYKFWVQPNRLERVWKQVKPELMQRWEKLSGGDWDACEYKYDLIVEAIRKIYYPGRSHLSLEGEIRDWLVARVAHYENAEKSH